MKKEIRVKMKTELANILDRNCPLSAPNKRCSSVSEQTAPLPSPPLATIAVAACVIHC